MKHEQMGQRETFSFDAEVGEQVATFNTKDLTLTAVQRQKTKASDAVRNRKN